MLIFRGILFAFGDRPTLDDGYEGPLVELFKVAPILSELGMIMVIYLWLNGKKRLQIILPSMIAFGPPFVIMSGWWGQFEPIYTLFSIIALMVLSRGYVLWAWLALGVSVLFKQPAAIITPVMLIMSYRRYGFRRTATGIAGCVALVIGATFPFFLSSGMDALSPYLKISGVFPYLTNNAHNLWYAVASIHKGGNIVYFGEFSSVLPVLGVFTFKTLGLVLFGAFVLLIMFLAWRDYRSNRIFLWAGMLYFAFFMLPTEVHERYIYPALPLLLLAATARPPLWIVFAGLIFTTSYNLLVVLNHTLASAQLNLTVSLVYVVLFVYATYLVMRRPQAAELT